MQRLTITILFSPLRCLLCMIVEGNSDLDTGCRGFESGLGLALKECKQRSILESVIFFRGKSGTN